MTYLPTPTTTAGGQFPYQPVLVSGNGTYKASDVGARGIVAAHAPKSSAAAATATFSGQNSTAIGGNGGPGYSQVVIASETSTDAWLLWCY